MAADVPGAAPATDAARPAPVCLLGPTATGKTSLALELAEALAAEIVSVDSGLVYRGLDIGTAKPGAAELARVPHHLIDIVEPTDPYSAARFVRDALAAIEAIRARGRRPLLVGGTMLYFNALQHGLAPMPAADAAMRETLEHEARERGPAAQHAELARVDPAAAARIHPHDPQRLQRALEVYRLTGRTLSELQADTRPALDEPLLKLALVPTSRAWLHARIERRLDEMLARGFLDEVRRLAALPGVHADLPALRSVGYRQALAAPGKVPGEAPGEAPGKIPPDGWRERALGATRRLAKRQSTWLRGMPDLVPLACDTLDERTLLATALGAVRTFDAERPPESSPETRRRHAGEPNE